MSTSVATVVEFLEQTFPLEWAETWDRVGLVAGDPEWSVTGIRLAVDPTVAEARAAAQQSGTLLITHHPLLLKGAHFLPATTGKGSVVTELVRAESSLWCGHTNADRSREGTVGAWINALGLEESTPLLPPSDPDSFGLGVIGTLPEATTVGNLARAISQHVPATAQGILHTGEADRTVRRVAVCPGAGDSFLDVVADTDADVYITSDLRHHPALEHLESCADHTRVPALIDLPHYASEFLYLPHLARMLREQFPGIPVAVSDLSSDPFTGAAR